MVCKGESYKIKRDKKGRIKRVTRQPVPSKTKEDEGSLYNLPGFKKKKKMPNFLGKLFSK